MKTQLTIAKRYSDIPFGHRQPNHSGHCAFIHGHNWSFEFEFACDKLEPGTGFIVDFGKLKGWKAELDGTFDHTLVLNDDDPLAAVLEATHDHDASAPGKWLDLVTVPDCSCEGLADYVFNMLNKWLTAQADLQARGVRCVRCTVFEDEKNSATVREVAS